MWHMKASMASHVHITALTVAFEMAAMSIIIQILPSAASRATL